MARVKATTTDIFAKLAKGECANYAHGGCQGRTPCLVVSGEPCEYFASYVKPLLEYPEFSAKYAREAKIAVALNPKAKVKRKAQVALTLDATEKSTPIPRVKTSAQAVAAPPPRAQKPSAPPRATRTVPVPALPAIEGNASPAKAQTLRAGTPAAPEKKRATRSAAVEQPQLVLEITPAIPAKRSVGRKRS